MKIIESGSTDLKDEKISGLYMGEPMSGKTHNLCTWPHPLVV